MSLSLKQLRETEFDNFYFIITKWWFHFTSMEAAMAIKMEDGYYITIEDGESIPNTAVEIAEPVKNYYSSDQIKIQYAFLKGPLITFNDDGPWENFLRKHKFM